MNKAKELLNRSYKSIVNRGLINDLTKDEDFYIKILEESKEFYEAIRFNDDISKIEEVTDLMNVCINYLIFRGSDPLEELEKVIIKNENRVKNKSNEKRAGTNSIIN